MPLLCLAPTQPKEGSDRLSAAVSLPGLIEPIMDYIRAQARLSAAMSADPAAPAVDFARLQRTCRVLHTLSTVRGAKARATDTTGDSAAAIAAVSVSVPPSPLLSPLAIVVAAFAPVGWGSDCGG